MSRLVERFRQNSALHFLDAATGQWFSLDTTPALPLPDLNRSLFFFYCGNNPTQIGTLLRLLDSNHVIALLPPNLAPHLKTELEALYQPDGIIDATRTEISGWSTFSPGVFLSPQQRTAVLHPDLKLLLSTSGTTGSPKFVKLSESNLLANAESIAAYLPMRKDDVVPLNLPVYYSYGLSVLTSNALAGGTLVCIEDDVLRKTFWEAFEKYQFTALAGVPFVYEMLDRIGFTKKIYPSLRYFTQAGGRLQEKLVTKYSAWAEENAAKFYIMYGQTEATARMSWLDPSETLKRPGSIGKAIPGGEFRIDAETSDLLYKGANVGGGYATGPDDLSTFEPAEWLHTGDLARVDDDGFYYITGRAKRFVKLFGSRINLDEVEVLLHREAGILARCIGKNDTQLIVFVTDEAHTAAVAPFLQKELSVHPTAVKTVLLEEIPVTANGKPDYKALEAAYGTV
jgi:acyl-CoA synthetase (AMP-forming)/AMP-acid ligase II